jgi:RHS repeat-associated protein
LFIPGEPNNQAYYAAANPGGVGSGSRLFQIPASTAVGTTWELRLLTGANAFLAISNKFTVDPPALTASPTSVAAGGVVTASWVRVPFPGANDSIRLYLVEAPDTSFVSSINTGALANGSVPFAIPATTVPGTYNLRLFSQAGGIRVVSNSFTVRPQNPTVSGTVTLDGAPFAGATFSATNGGTCTTSNASGQYSCSVPYDWAGVVTPFLNGYSTTPAARSYVNVTANLTGQNYTAVPAFQISGTVTFNGSPLVGAAFTATNGGICTTSDALGQYSCKVPQGWSGSVSGALSGYSLTPASRSYSSVTAHIAAQDYTAATVTDYQVSGTVTLNGAALAAVSFTATGGASCGTSNASGQYACTVPLGWTGTLTPSLTGYVFTPPWRGYNNVISDQTGQSFTAAVDSSLAKAFYIHPDHLNTPRVITNQAQQIVWRWDNDDPFGGNMTNENPSGLGVFTCNLRFPGQYFDRETNMHYKYFRDYSPEIGQYVESDPIGLRGGLNTYAYVSGNPIRFADLFGLASTSDDPSGSFIVCGTEEYIEDPAAGTRRPKLPDPCDEKEDFDKCQCKYDIDLAKCALKGSIIEKKRCVEKARFDLHRCGHDSILFV